jgi:hypothetical protein
MTMVPILDMTISHCKAPFVIYARNTVLKTYGAKVDESHHPEYPKGRISEKIKYGTVLRGLHVLPRQ